MVTIKDVAKKANVSIATVSNYINGKKAVSEATAVSIETAIQELNYVVQSFGRNLRISSSSEIGIIFPNISEPYLEKVLNSIKGYLTSHNKRFFLELTDSEPHIETNAVLNAISRKSAGIILYTCQQENTQLFTKLDSSKIPYILIDRKPILLDCNFICIDSRQLFYNLILAALRKKIQRISIVLGPKNYTENQTAAEGARKALLENNLPISTCRILHTTAIRECGFKAGIQILQDTENLPQLVMTNSYLLAEGIRLALKLYYLKPQKDIQIISTGDCIHDIFYNDTSILKTSRPSFEIGEQAARILLNNMKSPIVFDKESKFYEDSFSASSIKCLDPHVRKESAEQFADEITVLLIDEYSSVNSLSQLLRNFYEKEKIKVHIKKISPIEQYNFIENYMNSGRNDIDVILFDIPWLTYFASKDYLLCLDDFIHSCSFSFSHYIQGLMQSFGMYGGRYYALPYLACMQLLFYRKDLFQNEILKRNFEKQYMLSLKKPSNWFFFNTIAKFFTKEYNPCSPIDYGHTMSISYPENLFCDFLPRVWEYKADIYNNLTQLHKIKPQLENALRSICESVLCSSPDLFQIKPSDTVANFAQGNSAMLYTFYYYAMGLVDKQASKVYNDIGFTQLPGNPVLSGWSLGIPHNSRHAQSAFRFITWASCSEISIPQTILGGQSPNINVYNNYDMVSLYPWLPLSLSEFSRCKTRETVKDYRGKIISEKELENVFFQHIYPFLQNVYATKSYTTETLYQLMDNIQADLINLLERF